LNLPSGTNIKVWSSSEKETLVIPDGSNNYKRWPVGDQPSTLYVEGYSLGTAQLELLYTTDCQYPTYPGGGYENRDLVKFTVFDVDLLVNNTSSETDDYVVMEKSSGVRTTPKNTPAGATDNHIPMKIHLEGPSGFSCKVKLSDSGEGDVTIKKTDGSPYPTEGETVTVGTDLEVNIFGTIPSSDLDDVTIIAKTDKTGDRICAEEDLTVIWVYGSDMSFRGSNHQGEALTPGSTAKFTDIHSWEYDKVGKFIYKEPVFNDKDSALYNMELKNQVSPNKVISDVEWYIGQQISAAMWGPGTGTLEPDLYGPTFWYTETLPQDVIQNDPSPTEIFAIDGPGCLSLDYEANYRASQKVKARNWIEVNIGGKWYVCSPYKHWRSIMHVKFQDATTGWVEDTSKTNEIIVGTIDGFSSSWSEN
jgi:hypothetical protein